MVVKIPQLIATTKLVWPLVWRVGVGVPLAKTWNKKRWIVTEIRWKKSKARLLSPETVQIFLFEFIEEWQCYRDQFPNRDGLKDQGPWNLYGRDGKFHPTCKSGTETRGFSFRLLLTWCCHVDLPKYKLNTEFFKMHTFTPKCTILHRFAPKFTKNFPGVTLRTPRAPTRRCNSTVPLFQSFRGRCER